MSYGGDRYGGGGGGGYGNGRDEYGGQQGGYGGYGGGGRDEYGSQGGRQEHHGGRGQQGSYGGGRDEYGSGQQGGYGGGGRDEYGGGQQDSYGGNRQEHHGGSSGGYNSQGGEQYNRPGGQGSYGDDDMQGAMHHAQQHAGSSGDSSLFGNALGYLSGNKANIATSDLDENHAVNAHQAMYGSNQQNGGNHSSETVGAGAAMQALKMFSGGNSGGMGGGGGGMGAGSQGGGGGQNQFVGMAMAQASKLFDQQSGSGNMQQGANKQSAVQSAGEMALKMYMKSQGGGGGLMGMASKFM